MLMSDIYIGSFINIAANAASNANGGIFQDRDPFMVTPLRVRMTFRATRWLQRPLVIFPQTSDLGALEHAPLSKRAWTIQERLLAPRTVHFLQHKVVWECSSLHASESDTSGVLEQNIGCDAAVQEWVLPSPEDHILFHRETDCLWKWYHAVRIYTRGELTFNSDKLIAISGVARFLKHMWRDESVRYLAGLWSYQLEISLVWSSHEGTQLAGDEYLAPTWSWASVNGAIHNPFYCHKWRYELLSKVLEVQTEPINDTFGAVRAGFLRLSGPMCRVQLCTDRSPSTQLFELEIVSTGHKLEFGNMYFDTGRSGFPHTVTASNCYVLAGIYKRLDLSAVPMYGLLLQSTGNKDGQYTRIGSFDIDDSGPRNQNEEDAFNCLSKLLGGEESFSCESNHHMQIEDAYKSMDLPAQMYESKNTAAMTYTYEII